MDGVELAQTRVPNLEALDPVARQLGGFVKPSLLDRPATPASLVDDLYAMELQRIALNMQISLLHTLGRHALECSSRVAQAEAVYLRRAGADRAHREAAP